MSDTTTMLGVGPTIEFEGQQLQVKPLNYLRIGQFEVWLEGKMYAAVERHKARWPDGEYQARMSQVARDIAGGACAWDGEHAYKAIRTERGFLEALYLTFLKADDTPGLPREAIERLYREKGEEVAGTFFRVNFPPKVPPPTKTTSPPPSGGDPSGSGTSSESPSTATA